MATGWCWGWVDSSGLEWFGDFPDWHWPTGEATRQPHLGMGRVGGVGCWLGSIDSGSLACAAGLGFAAKVECHKTITTMAINLTKGAKRALATSGEVAMIAGQLTLSAALSLMLLIFLGA